MPLGEPLFLPAGRRFTEDEIVFYADRDTRGLDDALAVADVIVSTPHAGSLIPAEVAPYLDRAVTQRLQFDFTDMATSAITRRWAEIDRRIIVVENPHPRLVRDPNRPKPDDLTATLGEAFARVSSAGRPGTRVDLSGVDAIRPVMFNFMPLLTAPADAAGLERMARGFEDAAEQGLGVYERTRDSLVTRLLEKNLRGANPASGFCFTLSFHDTMNHTARADGAVNVERAPAGRLPDVVALSNRGDANGDPRGADPVTMAPLLLRSLADAHRTGFDVADPADVKLNVPYLGSQEVSSFGAMFRDLQAAAATAGVTLGAVQAEFLREYLLGGQAAEHIMEPGVDWPPVPAAWIDHVARQLHRSWDAFRAELAEPR